MTDYPDLFDTRRGGTRSIDVGDGWYSLIEALCFQVCRPYERARQQWLDLQSTTKDADAEGSARTSETLEQARHRMVEAANSLPVVVQIKQKLGGLRFYASGLRESDSSMVGFAEAYSHRVCEVCGCPGEVRTEGWLTALCDRHAVRSE